MEWCSYPVWNDAAIPYEMMQISHMNWLHVFNKSISCPFLKWCKVGEVDIRALNGIFFIVRQDDVK